MANIPLKITTQDPFIPLNSLILVTGINGLIASHIADQLLAAGYRVRGTVRNKSRCAWVEPFFTSRYGAANRLELVQVPDITAPGIWDAHVAGVSAVITVAGVAWLDDRDVPKAVNQELKCLYGLLHAAKTAGSDTVKAFIYTSSLWAAYTPKVGAPAGTLTEKSWNQEAVALAEDPSIPDAEKGLAPFMAIKVKVEEALWDWVAREKPTFTFNAMLISTVIGPILDPENQSASTAGWVRALYDGKPKQALEVMATLGPSWFIDARDVGRLYLGVLVSGLTGSRVYGFAERFNWKQPLDIFKDLYPEREELVELPGSYQCDESQVLADISLSLLRAIGQERWTSLEESIKDAAESFVSTGQSC
ncbi:NAD(P)-binding protein [Pseudoneurospora amorphoporcata]|uniref:NAD(P)-binding protein n=1 Tax=Pseudoneurospora amorphoporcata TaxID=241081 RepID=A0AAN6SCB2_9PEZI|nr:NAD(P)-binding protein [Pseudoneurospora amorphoporcata]